MTAVDIAADFIGHARQSEAQDPLGIDYRVASAVNLPFADATFDFATGFMSFMDVVVLGDVMDFWLLLEIE